MNLKIRTIKEVLAHPQAKQLLSAIAECNDRALELSGLTEYAARNPCVVGSESHNEKILFAVRSTFNAKKKTKRV